MEWIELLHGDPLPWLLEPDPLNPAVRYFALRDLLDRPDNDPEVRGAALDIMKIGPVPVILAAQHPEGYWLEPGTGHFPGYKSAAWQIILLAELGVDPRHPQVQQGCEYVLSHAISANGAFAISQPPVPSRVLHCHTGNLLHAMLRLGYAADRRVQAALNWQVQAITGEGEIRYYQTGTSGSGFACAVNLKQPCGWGATKAMKMLGAVPSEDRTPAIRRAINVGIEFLLSRDPAAADYPCTGRVSSTWFKFGFPLSYWSDVLETTAALVELGCGSDSRLAQAFQMILSKQDAQGRWKLENSLNGKMWIDIEKKGEPSKWITLRALRVLKRSAWR